MAEEEGYALQFLYLDKWSKTWPLFPNPRVFKIHISIPPSYSFFYFRPARLLTITYQMEKESAVARKEKEWRIIIERTISEKKAAHRFFFPACCTGQEVDKRPDAIYILRKEKENGCCFSNQPLSKRRTLGRTTSTFLIATAIHSTSCGRSWLEGKSRRGRWGSCRTRTGSAGWWREYSSSWSASLASSETASLSSSSRGRKYTGSSTIFSSVWQSLIWWVRVWEHQEFGSTCTSTWVLVFWTYVAIDQLNTVNPGLMIVAVGIPSSSSSSNVISIFSPNPSKSQSRD